MSIIARFDGTFFSPPVLTNSSHVIAWWEARRLRYDIMVGICGAISVPLYAWAIITSGTLRPGEDLIEPMAIPIALIAVPIAVNLCYTLGWLVDGSARSLRPSLSPRFSVLLLAMGVGFSFFVVSFPAVFWVGYRIMQVLHLI